MLQSGGNGRHGELLTSKYSVGSTSEPSLSKRCAEIHAVVGQKNIKVLSSLGEKKNGRHLE